jgi:hypothetical protein
LVCQTQFFPRQLAVIKPPRWPTGCLQSGGHRRESRPLRACRFGAITSAKSVCAPNRLIHGGARGLRQRTGVSEEGGLGREIADASDERDAQADVSTAGLSVA